jgi:hypothetical protein
MTGGGVAISLVVWLLTGSAIWALVALLASGPLLNAIAQLVIQPARAVRGAARGRDEPH